MTQLYKAVASIMGIGFIKGGGTIAAAITGFGWYLLQPGFITGFLLVVISIVIGVWVSNEVEKDWGTDSNKVVIDEVAGMAVTLLFIPSTLLMIATGFVLFRFFDIVKPLGIRKTEQLKGGWGVMTDDVVAGIYANVVLEVIVLTGISEKICLLF
ncbi:MAG: phosphatidylglycerophosphatase A [Ginsengibacter sp.]